MSGPIKPSDVQKKKDAGIPEEVFQVFNDLIAENWDGYSANFTQNAAVTRIVKKLGITRSIAYDKGYLDVESAYRKAGWKVEYDKPGYNEDYDAFFLFRKKRS